MRRAIWIAIIAVACAIGSDLSAQQRSFDLTIRGLRVGVISYDARVRAGEYQVSATIRNTGLTRVVRQFGYSGQVKGKANGQDLNPERYQEVADTGKRQSEVKMRYHNRTPVVETYTSTREKTADSPNPKDQRGSVDPLTAIFALLRDVPKDASCDVSETIFDGARQSVIFMRPAGQQDGLPICKGYYERQQGFSPEEIARHKRFDFTLSYVQLGDGALGVNQVVFDSIYGKAAIKRQ